MWPTEMLYCKTTPQSRLESSENIFIQILMVPSYSPDPALVRPGTGTGMTSFLYFCKTLAVDAKASWTTSPGHMAVIMLVIPAVRTWFRFLFHPSIKKGKSGRRSRWVQKNILDQTKQNMRQVVNVEDSEIQNVVLSQLVEWRLRWAHGSVSGSKFWITNVELVHDFLVLKLKPFKWTCLYSWCLFLVLRSQLTSCEYDCVYLLLYYCCCCCCCLQ